MMLNIQQFLFSVFCFLVIFTNFSSAQTVLINRASGHGYIFKHNGICYVTFPGHVVKRKTKFNLLTEAPTTTGDAIILPLRSSVDLGLAYLTPGLEHRCLVKWSSLPKSIDLLLSTAKLGTMRRLTANGRVESVPVRINSYDLYSIEVEALKAKRFSQGNSGASLYINDRFAGMALETYDGKSAKFLRSDDLKQQLERLVVGQSGSLPKTTDQLKINGGTAELCSKSKYSVSSVTCNKEPISEDFTCSRILTDSPTLFPANALPLEIDIRLSTDAPAPLHSVEIKKINVEEYASIKSVETLISTSAANSPARWRNFDSGDALPNSLLLLKNGSRPYAQSIKLIIGSTWEPSKPFGIGCISIR